MAAKGSERQAGETQKHPQTEDFSASMEQLIFQVSKL